MGQEGPDDVAVLTSERKLVGGLGGDKMIDTFTYLKFRGHTLMISPKIKRESICTQLHQMERTQKPLITLH